MNKRISVLILIAFYSCKAPSSDVAKIKVCFSKYKTAILTQDGKSGIECVDSKTIEYYDEMIKKIKSADSSEIENETPYNKLTILKVRQSVIKDTLLSMDGKALLSFLISEGKAGSATISDQEIDSIKIKDNQARAERLFKGKRTPFVYAFYKEQNDWKLYMAGLIPVHNSSLKQSIFESGLQEDEYILNFIEQTCGSKPTNDIWHPLTFR